MCILNEILPENRRCDTVSVLDIILQCFLMIKQIMSETVYARKGTFITLLAKAISEYE